MNLVWVWREMVSLSFSIIINGFIYFLSFERPVCGFFQLKTHKNIGEFAPWPDPRFQRVSLSNRIIFFSNDHFLWYEKSDWDKGYWWKKMPSQFAVKNYWQVSLTMGSCTRHLIGEIPTTNSGDLGLAGCAISAIFVTEQYSLEIS